MSTSNMPVQASCDAILRQPCPYKVPPFTFLGGHSFCTCMCQAIRTAYIGGYAAAKEGREPEMGVIESKPIVVTPEEESNEQGC